MSHICEPHFRLHWSVDVLTYEDLYICSYENAHRDTHAKSLCRCLWHRDGNTVFNAAGAPVPPGQVSNLGIATNAKAALNDQDEVEQGE